MIDLLWVALISGAAGTGFALLVIASPLGRLKFKPFSCKTCLSGWGAIGASGVLLHLLHPHVNTEIGMWVVLSLAGTGVAHLFLRDTSSTPVPSEVLPPEPPR